MDWNFEYENNIEKINLKIYLKINILKKTINLKKIDENTFLKCIKLILICWKFDKN